VVAFVHWVKHPLRDTIPGLEVGFKHAVAAGNLVFATGCAYNLMRTSWSTTPLPQIMTFIGTLFFRIPYYYSLFLIYIIIII
jgi:hypothetical protein